jgi:hypothetical protein
MNCCICNGTCNHVGPHSFCVAHGGGIAWPTTPTTTTTTTPLAFRFRFRPATCEHCWCWNEGDHNVCCNCGMRRRAMKGEPE